MNGRQKAMTGLLMMGDSRYGRATFDATPPVGDPLRGIDPLEALKLIVAECEKGNIAIVNLSSEMFRQPRGFSTYDSDFKSIVPGDCTMTLNMEIAPSGRVRDDYVSAPVGSGGAGGSGSMGGGGGGYVNVTVNGVGGDGDSSVDFADTDGDPLDDYEEKENFAGLPTAGEAKAKRKRERDAEPPKPVTPTGASAAREVIFDDDEGSVV